MLDSEIIRALFTVFITVFIAEMGDKTQLATMLFAADKAVSPWMVFLAASLALVATTAIGVLVGSSLAGLINPKWLQILAGLGFVLIGCWTLWAGIVSPTST